MGHSRRILLILDVIIGVLVALNVAACFFMWDQEYRSLVVVGGICSVGLGLVWILWRRTQQLVWLAVLVIFSGPAGLSGGGGVSLLLILLGLAMLVAEAGLLAGLLGIAYHTTVSVVLMVLAWRRELVAILTEGMVMVLMGALGLLLGQLLRELQKERRANRALLAELRASHDIEKELMLAEERARSARELHDGLGHRLTLIGMSLEYATRMCEKDPEKAYAEVEQAREQTSDALAYMRRWVRALNPPRDTDLTGIAAFEAISESFRGTGLKVEVHQTGEEHPLGKEASLFAYRLVQEGLTNVLRHSNADEVDITVHWQGDGVEIELADNGRERGTEGLDDTEAGFGLRSLTERAEQLGGHFAARVDERGVVLTGSVREGKHA